MEGAGVSNVSGTDLERDYMLFHLERLGGDTRALCRFLGFSRQQLYRRCARLGIKLRGKTRLRPEK